MRGGTLVTQPSHRRLTLLIESPRPMSMLGGRPTTCRRTRISPSRFPLLRVPRQQADTIWQRLGLPPEQPRPVIWCMQQRQSSSHLLHGDGVITLLQFEPRWGVGRSARGEDSGCSLTSRSPRRRWSGKPRCWARHSNALGHYVHMGSFLRNWRPNGGNHAFGWDSGLWRVVNLSQCPMRWKHPVNWRLSWLVAADPGHPVMWTLTLSSTASLVPQHLAEPSIPYDGGASRVSSLGNPHSQIQEDQQAASHRGGATYDSLPWRENREVARHRRGTLVGLVGVMDYCIWCAQVSAHRSQLSSTADQKYAALPLLKRKAAPFERGVCILHPCRFLNRMALGSTPTYGLRQVTSCPSSDGWSMLRSHWLCLAIAGGDAHHERGLCGADWAARHFDELFVEKAGLDSRPHAELAAHPTCLVRRLAKQTWHARRSGHAVTLQWSTLPAVSPLQAPCPGKFFHPEQVWELGSGIAGGPRSDQDTVTWIHRQGRQPGLFDAMGSSAITWRTPLQIQPHDGPQISGGTGQEAARGQSHCQDHAEH